MSLNIAFDLGNILRTMFNLADKDKDGTLSRSELYGFLTKQGYKFSWNQFEKLFQSVDTDKSGSVSYEEFTTAMTSVPQNTHRDAIYRNKFKKYDRDGDSSITAEEFRLAMIEMDVKNEDFIKESFERADKNKDGKIDIEEFIASQK